MNVCVRVGYFLCGPETKRKNKEKTPEACWSFFFLHGAPETLKIAAQFSVVNKNVSAAILLLDRVPFFIVQLVLKQVGVRILEPRRAHTFYDEED